MLKYKRVAKVHNSGSFLFILERLDVSGNWACAGVLLLVVEGEPGIVNIVCEKKKIDIFA